MTPNYFSWVVEALHPDKTEPFNTYIRAYTTEKLARARMVELEAEGYEHIHLRPPEQRPVTPRTPLIYRPFNRYRQR